MAISADPNTPANKIHSGAAPGAVPSSKTDTRATAKQASAFSLALLAGWLVPGAGHWVARRPVRGSLLFVSIVLMFVLGLLMQGKLYAANTGNTLDMLGFVGDLGGGLMYAVARAMDLGHGAVQIATADYGTKFIVVAGLLNIISAVDAHNIRIGRKP